MTQEQSIVTTYFSKDPYSYAEHYGKETPEGYSFRVRKERLLESLGKGTGAVLDIGCGPAVMTKEIVDGGWTYVGIDVSEAMIDEARKRSEGTARALFQVGTVEHIASESASFDAVVAMGLVEYVEDDVAAIKEMHRVLKKEGKLFVSLPNVYSPVRMWDKYILTPLARLIRLFTKKQTKNIIHREYAPAGYCQLLQEHGFINTKIVAYNMRLIPRPFDMWFPRLSVRISTWCEVLRNTPLWWLATGVNIEATKE